MGQAQGDQEVQDLMVWEDQVVGQEAMEISLVEMGVQGLENQASLVVLGEYRFVDSVMKFVDIYLSLHKLIVICYYKYFYGEITSAFGSLISRVAVFISILFVIINNFFI